MATLITFNILNISRHQGLTIGKKTGLVSEFEKNKIGPILASTGCQFIKVLHYPGNIVVQARIEFMKNTSFGIHHEILNDDGEVVAEAHDVIVVYDFKKNEKAPIQKEFRDAVEKIEGRTF